ncbi:MAG: PEP-CTERM sorting domain-containing protein [Moorea sp. SIO2B7]|nr:PEP-CTERM sorting domain-containing protein [Moorena sp. SIO2B7]
MNKIIQLTIQSTFLLGMSAAPAAAFNLTPIGTFSTGIFDDSAAQESAYDPVTENLWVTNDSTLQITVLGISNPNNPLPLFDIELEQYGNFGGVNSIDYGKNMFAVAVENDERTNPGSVLFFNPKGDLLQQVTVGALPDNVVFTPDATKLLVANEGEPSDDYTIDPEGSVSIINPETWSVHTARFDHVPLIGDVRIFGPEATVAQDLEPEFITVVGDKAYVTLQENNAVGVLDLEKGEFEEVVGLGFKDHSKPGNGLDASNKDNAINIQSWPVFGLLQPDHIASYIGPDGKTYLVTANEGDSREYEFEDGDGNEIVAFNEETTVADVVLDPDAFPNAEELQEDENLGRLEITNTLGDTDGDGDFDELYAFGGRSVSIWTEGGDLVWDSGDQFEKLVAKFLPDDFNSNNDENQSFDNRSDNKGPEPEGIALAKFGYKTYAFIGLERVGGIMTYDVTDPFNPTFVDYVNNRNFSVVFEDEDGDPDPTPEQLAAWGDSGPEGLLFISGDDSPNGVPLLVVANEVSGTTTIYEIKEDSKKVPEPSSLLSLLGFGAFGYFKLKRKQ